MGWGSFAMDFAKPHDVLLPIMGPQYTKLEYQKLISLIPCFKKYVFKIEDDMYVEENVKK